MNKSTAIKKFKEVLELAKVCKTVSEQNLANATRLEREAETALEELGVQKGRGRKAYNNILSEEQMLKLRASIG